jgi:hypothetical protein
MYDLIVLGSVQRPMDVRATFRGIRFELFEIMIQMSERVLFDVRGNLAQFLMMNSSAALAGSTCFALLMSKSPLLEWAAV